MSSPASFAVAVGLRRIIYSRPRPCIASAPPPLTCAPRPPAHRRRVRFSPRSRPFSPSLRRSACCPTLGCRCCSCRSREILPVVASLLSLKRLCSRYYRSDCCRSALLASLLLRLSQRTIVVVASQHAACARRIRLRSTPPSSHCLLRPRNRSSRASAAPTVAAPPCSRRGCSDCPAHQRPPTRPLHRLFRAPTLDCCRAPCTASSAWAKIPKILLRFSANETRRLRDEVFSGPTNQRSDGVAPEELQEQEDDIPQNLMHLPFMNNGAKCGRRRGWQGRCGIEKTGAKPSTSAADQHRRRQRRDPTSSSDDDDINGEWNKGITLKGSITAESPLALRRSFRSRRGVLACASGVAAPKSIS
ncbi:hypothetical protein Taro_024786, partial [Colocasia esculenta]|nr:hypothetical protein [Colocasia esculenta]